jgi:hypothetical protein
MPTAAGGGGSANDAEIYTENGQAPPDAPPDRDHLQRVVDSAQANLDAAKAKVEIAEADVKAAKTAVQQADKDLKAATKELTQAGGEG